MSLGLIEGLLHTCKFVPDRMFLSVQHSCSIWHTYTDWGKFVNFNEFYNGYERMEQLCCTVLNVIEKQKSNVANDARYRSKLFLVTLLLTFFIIKIFEKKN